jgi:hypothetical protein
MRWKEKDMAKKGGGGIREVHIVVMESRKCVSERGYWKKLQVLVEGKLNETRRNDSKRNSPQIECKTRGYPPNCGNSECLSPVLVKLVKSVAG